MSRHPAFERIEHRPWPVPAGRWSWRQSWCDLLFAHWPAPAAALQPLVPPELTVQERDGTSWIGVVPFHMRGVMLRPLPDLPGISAFPELNLRLYVEHRGRPGVWFLSLDAANPLAVWAARRFFHLPYLRARMRIAGLPDHAEYESLRLSPPRGVAFRARYRPVSDPYEAKAARSSTGSPSATASTRARRAGTCCAQRSITSPGRCSARRRKSSATNCSRRTASR